MFYVMAILVGLTIISAFIWFVDKVTGGWEEISPGQADQLLEEDVQDTRYPMCRKQMDESSHTSRM